MVLSGKRLLKKGQSKTEWAICQVHLMAQSLYNSESRRFPQSSIKPTKDL